MISQPIEDITWQYDFQVRMNPELLNQLLRDSIPVLEHLNWQVQQVTEGGCVALLPLNHQATNQHGTHQGALIGMSADYTGGIAIASLLRGVPIGGVHPSKKSERAALWLANMQVKYIAPSSGDLISTCNIPESQQEKIKSRYFQGRRSLIKLDVQFESNDELVAIATMTYFLETPSVSSLEKGPSQTLVNHALKSSARLIAGLRGQRSARTDTQQRFDSFQCPYSELVAGPHGKLLAEKLSVSLPQLGDLINARTVHLDHVLEQALADGVKQVVCCGVGLDMRMFRMAAQAPDYHAKYYELDLPPMLAERSRTLALIPNLPGLDRQMIEVDLIKDDLQEQLQKHSDFQCQEKTLFILEGCSMYFDVEQNRRLFKQLQSLVQVSNGLLWADFVSERVVQGGVQAAAVHEFFEEMENMGEAFVFGHDNPHRYLQDLGFTNIESVVAREWLASDDPLMDEYCFAVATARRPAQKVRQVLPGSVSIDTHDNWPTSILCSNE